jgi:hypothetical protein
VKGTKVEDSLCDLLADAETAELAGDLKKKQKLLDKYVKELEKQVGKTITQANAEFLIGLVREL